MDSDILLERLLSELESCEAPAQRVKLLELIGKHKRVSAFERAEVNINLGELTERLVQGRRRVLESDSRRVLEGEEWGSPGESE